MEVHFWNLRHIRFVYAIPKSYNQSSIDQGVVPPPYTLTNIFISLKKQHRFIRDKLQVSESIRTRDALRQNLPNRRPSLPTLLTDISE